MSGGLRGRAGRLPLPSTGLDSVPDTLVETMIRQPQSGQSKLTTPNGLGEPRLAPPNNFGTLCQDFEDTWALQLPK